MIKKRKRQTTVHKTQHKKLTAEQHESHQQLDVFSGDPEE